MEKRGNGDSDVINVQPAGLKCKKKLDLIPVDATSLP